MMANKLCYAIHNEIVLYYSLLRKWIDIGYYKLHNNICDSCHNNDAGSLESLLEYNKRWLKYAENM